jgi:hypothetical protein
VKIETRLTKLEGFVQITTTDERFYIDEKNGGEPYPSASWVSGYYPKGVEFFKWLASKGWDEAEAIKEAAGMRGGKIHKGIEVLLAGKALAINDALPDGNGLVAEPTVEEWEGIMSFADWWGTLESPELISTEQTVLCNEPVRFAGTQDLKVKIGEDVWIIDFKSGQSIWPSYEIQVAAYKHCEGNEDVTKCAILQVGYKKNKRGWKFTEVKDRWSLFLSVYDIWWAENENVHPKQKDYPTSLSIKL